MHTIDIYAVVNGVKQKHAFTFPSSWEEATAEHLLTICRVQTSLKSDTSKRFTLLRELAGIPGPFMRHLPPAEDLMYRIDVTDRSGPWKPVEKFEWRLLPQLDWAFKPPVYTNSLLTSVEVDGVRWRGVQNELKGMSLAQWIWTTTFLGELRKADDSAKEQVLHELLGLIYVPEGPEAPWNPDLRTERGQALRTLPVELKLATVLNCEAIHATLPLTYRRVFDPDGEVQRSPAGLYGMAYDVAASGVFGEADSAEMQPVMKVLDYMEHKLFQDEVQEAKLEAQRRTN
jgi:hypothetical protein